MFRVMDTTKKQIVALCSSEEYAAKITRFLHAEHPDDKRWKYEDCFDLAAHSVPSTLRQFFAAVEKRTTE